MSAPAFLLFDLDGTLVDTAPELAAAVNALRVADGFAPLGFDTLRPVCSQGAVGLLGRAYGITPDDAAFPRLRERFLEAYGADFAPHSLPFAGIDTLLEGCEALGLAWGIVTNKPRAYALPILDALDWQDRCAVLVAGDDAERPKPAPDPVLLACESLQRAPSDGLYVGDDPRDVAAARAAGMPVAAVSWGYTEEAPPIAEWGADWVCYSPEDVAALLPEPA